MIEYIPEILDAGIDSLKIEGRMKTALYVAAVARTYRQAIDDYKKSPELYASRMEYYREEIAKCTYRQFTTGFYFGKTDEKAQIYDQNTYVKEYTYIGIVEGHNEEGHAYLMQRNKFSVGETVEVMNPNGENLLLTVKGIRDEDGNAMEAAPHPKQMLYVDFGQKIETGWLIRRKED
jgi:putative protease